MNIVKVLLKNISLGLLLYSIYLLILLTLPYLNFQPGIEFLETKQFIYHIDAWRYSFYLHIFSSPVIISTGTLLIFFRLEKKQKALHRFLGKIYILTILLVSGPSALIMGLYANGGYPAQISFVVLAFLWIIFTYLSCKYAKSNKIDKHKYWMYRSFALTLSAVTLRFYAFIIDYYNFNIPPIESYILLAYLSWIPNLLVLYLLEKTRVIKYNY